MWQDMEYCECSNSKFPWENTANSIPVTSKSHTNHLIEKSCKSIKKKRLNEGESQQLMNYLDTQKGTETVSFRNILRNLPRYSKRPEGRKSKV